MSAGRRRANSAGSAPASMDLSPIPTAMDSPMSLRNNPNTSFNSSRGPDSPSVMGSHRQTSFFVIQDDQCPLGTKIGKLWKRHRANRIYETFFFKTVNEHLYYYKWKFEAENQEQPRGAYSLVGAEVVRKGKNIFLYVEDSKDPKRMFCMEERKAREWEQHLKNRIAWSTPLPGAKRRQYNNHQNTTQGAPGSGAGFGGVGGAAALSYSNSFHVGGSSGAAGDNRRDSRAGAARSSRRRGGAGSVRESKHTVNGDGGGRRRTGRGRYYDDDGDDDDEDFGCDDSPRPSTTDMSGAVHGMVGGGVGTQAVSLPMELKYSYSPFEEMVLCVSKLTLLERLVSVVFIVLLVAYYVYAPTVLADHFGDSKMATVLGSLSFLAVLSMLVQVVFKTSIVTELEEGGYI